MGKIRQAAAKNPLAKQKAKLPGAKTHAAGVALATGQTYNENDFIENNNFQEETEQPPPPMPLPSDEDVEAARRRSIARQRARSGRTSTIFTQGNGLGG